MAQAGTVWVDVRGDMSKFASDVAGGAKKAGASVTSALGSGAKTVVSDLGTAAGVTGIAIAGIGAAAVKTSTDFNAAMSGVGAVANASAGELESLRDAALKAGADTVFSASEAATAQAELVKAGVSVSDTLGGALTGSLSLAAAGQLELADAATISAQAMNIFELSGADVGHIADVLAAGANKSAADVGQLGDALRQGGLVAKQTGLSMEETVGVLSLFADNALIGSDAGTSLKTMLQRLVPQSDEAAEAMKEMGLQFFDAQGAFVGIDEVAAQLQTSLAGLSDEQRQNALTTLFGSDAVRGASILMEGGKAAVDEYTAAVNDMGAAQRMAAAQTDNLKGDIEAFSGAVETSLINIGDLSDSALREITQAGTGLVNVFNEFATTPAWDAIERNISGLTAGAGDQLDGIADGIRDVLMAIDPAEIDRVFSKATEGLSTIREAARGAEGVIAGLGLSLAGLGASAVLGPLGGIIPTISPITGVLGGLVLGSEEGRDALFELGKQAAAFATGPGADLLESLSGLAIELSGAVASALEDVGGAVIDAASQLGPVLGDSIDQLGPPLADLVESLGELTGEVLPLLADFVGAVLPPAVDVFGAGLSVAAGAVGLLAENTELLVPALAAVAALKFADQFRGIGDVVKGAATNVGTFRDAIGQIAATQNVSKLEALKGVAGATAKEVGGLAGGFLAANGPLIALTGAVALGATVWQNYSQNVADVKDISNDLSAALEQTRSEFAKTTEERSRQVFVDKDALNTVNEAKLSLADLTEVAAAYSEEVQGLDELFEINTAGQFGDPESINDFREAIEELPGPVRDVASAIFDMYAAGDIGYQETLRFFEALDELAQGTAASTEDAKDKFTSMAQEAAAAGKITADELAGILEQISTAETPDELNTAFNDLAALLGVTTSEAKAAADEMQRLIDLIDKLSNSERDADEASRRLAETRDRVTTSFTENGAGIDANTEAGRKNADAIQAQIEASERLSEAQALLDPTGQQSTLTLIAQRQALEELAAQGLLTAEELARLIDIYNLTDQDIQATVSADVSQAEASLAEVQAEFNKVKDDLEVPVQTEIQALIDQGKYAEAEARLAQLERDRVVSIKATVTTSANSVVIATEKAINMDINGNGVIGMASGGVVKNRNQIKLPGFGTDTELIMATPGEHVMPAGRVAEPGMLPLLEGLRAGVIDPKSVQGYEMGGLVSDAAPVMPIELTRTSENELRVIDSMSTAGVEQRLDTLAAHMEALADSMSAVATRQLPRPIIDVRATADVQVTAQQRARGMRSGD